MGTFGVQRWRQAALCWLRGRVSSAQRSTIRQALVLSRSHSHAVRKGQRARWDKARVPSEGCNA